MEGDIGTGHTHPEPPERESPLRFGGLVGGILLLCAAKPSLGQSATRCGTPEHRQFDFWAGDWNVFDVGNADSGVAHARVERILEGCALREIYDGRNGLSGQSLSIYDSGRRRWHQSWVTNRGQLLVIEGRLKGDRMVLEGAYPPGSSTMIRGIWSRMGNAVRETAETSSDGGKTWQPLFDLVFRKVPHH